MRVLFITPSPSPILPYPSSIPFASLPDISLQASQFSDIPDGHWAYQPLMEMYDGDSYGVVQEKEDILFIYPKKDNTLGSEVESSYLEGSFFRHFFFTPSASHPALYHLTHQ
ncbi:hypothetical protein [Brevibacillus sp. MS2.2]|uniref:hypothetical protein n=1 Tax=Brevibacillus sp. MS2.2 TaxID=2738981 RepID=UPI00156B022A|nr:hypothetical protein [Brevibacillus sp. MS2.2]NRR24217.1 hypothetical protein [Brevibacillus sp. MS2.2]